MLLPRVLRGLGSCSIRERANRESENAPDTCVARRTSDGRLKRGLMSENSTHTQSHIDSIAKQEHEFLEQRTFLERVGDRVAGFAGSMFFVLFHILLVVFWVLINANRVPWIPRFDPYPFSLLGMIVAVEAVVLSTRCICITPA